MLRTGWVVVAADHLGVAAGGQTPGRERLWHPAAFPSVLGFPFLTDALLAFPNLTGSGTLRLSGPLHPWKYP